MDRHRLEDFSAVYFRLSGPTTKNEDTKECVFDILLDWLEIAPVPVLNRPSAMCSNFSKPYQLQLIQNQGFAVPATLVTNDPDQALSFCAEHRQVVYKSISGIRSVVRLLGDEERANIESILWCPTQFQAYVHGCNVRVHVVGEEAYGTVVLTRAVDYRYAYLDGCRAELAPISIPSEISRRCVMLAKSLGLTLAGIDLIVSEWDNPYCLEVNPSPAFAYYEDATGQPISRAVASYLASPTS
jgi:glutathione synthase/RimK-type ligase-like ATP-grasp enzyme